MNPIFTKSMRYLTIILLVGLYPMISEAQWKLLLPEKTYTVSVNPKNPKSMLVGGINRKIYRTFDGGITWDTLVVSFQSSSPTVKMTNVFIHPIDTNIIIVGGINFSTIQRSTDGGKNWNVVLEGTIGEKYPIAMTSEVIISDAINPNIVYAGDYSSTLLFKSSDRGASWDSVTFIKGVNVCTITMLPNTATMFAGCRTGSIRKSTDTGKTWREVADFTNGLFFAEVPTIIFSKKNPNVGYAVSAYDRYKDLPNGGVFKTIDGGETWSKIGYGDTSLWAIAIRTLGWQDDVYIGGYAESGFPEHVIPGQGVVSRSSNSGASWERIDNSIAWCYTTQHNVWVMKFVEDTPQNEKLYMATEAGFFVMDMPVSVEEKEQELTSEEWNGTIQNGVLTVKAPNTAIQNSSYTIRLYSMLGEKLIEKTSTVGNEFYVGNCSKGIYMCEIITNQTRKKILVLSL